MAARKSELVSLFVEDLGLAPEAAGRFAEEHGGVCAAADPCRAAAELAAALAEALRTLDDDDPDAAYGRAVADLKMAGALVVFLRKKALQGFLFELLRGLPFECLAVFRFVEAHGAALFEEGAPHPYFSRERAAALLRGLAARAAGCGDADGLADIVRDINMALAIVEF